MSELNRRAWLRATGLSIAGAGASGWLPAVAAAAAKSKATEKRHCILLWMSGGPSQLDTFDMKPGHENGGPFKEIATSVAGVRFSEHLPGLAKQADKLAIVRSLSTKEGDHGRGTYLMRTGHRPMGPIQYPTIGSSLSKALGDRTSAIPNFVSIAPYRVFNRAAFGPGFLGPKYAPLTVGALDRFQAQQAAGDNSYAELKVDDLGLPEGVSRTQMNDRFELWDALQEEFLAGRPTASPVAHDTVFRRARRLIRSREGEAFDLSREPDKVRQAYGRSKFGQGCLMARRLVERGVPFVEVSLGRFGGGALGWDTHRNNFDIVKQLSAELDAGWSSLMRELDDRGLLERTTILWIGEFGRTPKINRGGGRDHYPKAWSTVFAGGGINGGAVYGKTSPDGMEVGDGQCHEGDVLATLCKAVGVSPGTENVSEMGRPIRIAEGEPIKELVARG